MAAETQLKEAVDYCRRNNLRLLVIGSGLLLAWMVNLEGSYSVTQAIVVQSRKTDTQIANLGNVLKTVTDTRDATVKKIEERPDEQKSAERRVKKLNAQIERINASKKKAAEDKTTLDRALTENVTFDVGGGLKLPFAFNIAPMVWMAVFLYLQISAILSRADFWRLLAIPASRMSVADRSNGSLLTYDLPLWVYPIPVFDQSFGISRQDAAATIGVSPRRLKVMQAIHQLMVLFAAAIAVRVLVIGNFLYGQVLPEPRYAIVLDLLFGASIACTLWSLRPARIVPDRPELAESVAFERRTFVSGSAVCLATAFGAGALLRNWYALSDERARQNIRDAYLQYTKRHPSRAQSSLTSGFYRHRRNGNLYYIQQNGVVFGGGQKLKESNLERADLAPPDDPGNAAYIRTAGGLSVLAVGFETEAIRLATTGNPTLGFDFIFWYVHEVASRSFRSAGPPLRQIDLAAGLAIRYELGDRLARLTEVCQDTWFDNSTYAVRLTQSSRKQPDIDDAILAVKARCDRWNSAKAIDAKWRDMRWGSKYPLRWDGRRYDS